MWKSDFLNGLYHFLILLFYDVTHARKKISIFRIKHYFFINLQRLSIATLIYDRIQPPAIFFFQKIRVQLEAINFAFNGPLLDPFRNLSDFRKFSALKSILKHTENMTRCYKWLWSFPKLFWQQRNSKKFLAHFIYCFSYI